MKNIKYIKHICFIVPNYPTKNDPVYTFVGELVKSIADLGIKCSVIAPQSISNFIFKKYRKRPFFWQDISDNNNIVDIYQPLHAPFLNLKLFGFNLSGKITKWSVKRTFHKLKLNPDILYAHFWHSGVIAGSIGQENNIPTYVATGESKIWVSRLFGDSEIQTNLRNINGVICVSTKNLEESIELGLASKENSIVIPNSINNKTFYHMDKNKIRKRLGFKQDDFIVAYVGAFSNRKGVERLSKAIEKVPGTKSIFIGRGPLKPTCDGILFSGTLPHNKVAEYLNAADVFVLPTLAEGCSNAIIEAMACGLPIISSDLSFNDDVLTEENSIRIDSTNVEEIANAINYLKENPDVRKKMSYHSLKLAKDLDINSRAKKILKFINKTGEKDVVL